MLNRQIAVDPVTLEVVGNHLVSIVDEMATTISRTSYSTVIREMGDFTTGVFGADGALYAQSAHIPPQQGTLSESAKLICREVALEPEDIIIFNHPHMGGTHSPDIMIFKPVFLEGEMIGLVGTLGHHMDIGGRSPGSNPSDALDVFEEGLLLPPLKLMRRGVMNEDVIAIIRANIRYPHKTIGDLWAQISAVGVGEKRFLELASKYGRKRLREICIGLMDHSERLMRNDLRELPDGSYFAEGFMDGDGISDQPIRIAVTVTLDDGTVTIDYTGSSPQVRGPFNISLSSMYAGTWCAVRHMVSPEILQNEGCYRPIRVIAPLGTVVRPHPPAAVTGRFHTLARMCDTIIRAFNQARDEKATGSDNAHLSTSSISGKYPGSQKGYVFFDACGGGWGGTYVCDGMDGAKGLMSNARDCPIEVAEMEYPLRIERYELIPDSGGPGKFRGGMGLYRATRFLHGDGYFVNRSDGTKFPPHGTLGGMKGAPARHTLIRKDGTVIRLPSKVTYFDIHEGDLLHYETAAGGGYGHPWEREPQRVLDDLLDGKISLDSARDIYRVAVDLKTGIVDEEETARLRAEPPPEAAVQVAQISDAVGDRP